MNGINSVRITVNGVNYTINTVEPEEYVQKLADELNGAVSEIRDKNSTISFNDIMVLCAINYIDAYKRSEENADRMRTQISEYLEDAAKARIELDEVRRENAHLRRQLSGKETKGQIKDPKAGAGSRDLPRLGVRRACARRRPAVRTRSISGLMCSTPAAMRQILHGRTLRKRSNTARSGV